MMRIALFALFILCSWSLRAGDVWNDTVMPGYYIPFESNFMSCKVKIAPLGKPTTSVNATGNRISDSLLRVISTLEIGSSVWYDEITRFDDGKLYKTPPQRFVIGTRNSVRAVQNPFYQESEQRAEINVPDTMSAKEIGSLVLDRHVYSFTVSWIINGNMYTYDLTGNGIFGEARTKIEELPSGTKVYVENIRRQEDDGSKRIMPTEIHIVK